MDYQSKTTLATIAVGNWSETTHSSLSSQFTAAQAVAVQIASQCQMDIISFIPYSVEGECLATVVYLNNGRSPADIRRIMAPEFGKKPPTYWMLQDITEWQGALECIVSTRGTEERWE